SGVDDVLGFLQSEGGQRADLLDDGDLLVTGSFEDNVEGILLLFSCSVTGTAGGACNGNGSGGDLEGLLELLDELGEFDDGQFLESFNELVVGELSHGWRSF